MALLKLREKEFCLGFRTILENSDKILIQIISINIENKIAKVHHINSNFTRIRNVPKDVLVNFARKKTSFATTF